MTLLSVVLLLSVMAVAPYASCSWCTGKMLNNEESFDLEFDLECRGVVSTKIFFQMLGTEWDMDIPENKKKGKKPKADGNGDVGASEPLYYGGDEEDAGPSQTISVNVGV